MDASVIYRIAEELEDEELLDREGFEECDGETEHVKFSRSAWPRSRISRALRKGAKPRIVSRSFSGLRRRMWTLTRGMSSGSLKLVFTTSFEIYAPPLPSRHHKVLQVSLRIK